MINFIRKHTEHIKNRWFHYGLETIVVIIGILVAIAVDNLNNNRKDRNVEEIILSEISEGLNQDLLDIESNIYGHNSGLRACEYFRKIVNNEHIDADSFHYYYHYLVRDFTAMFNTSGYESLKSRGLELIRNDSLRVEIISLYEQDYSSLRKMEEEYHGMQYQENYIIEINNLIASHIVFNKQGDIVSIELPLNLLESEKKMLLSYLWKIKMNRDFTLHTYSRAEQKIKQLLANIENN